MISRRETIAALAALSTAVARDASATEAADTDGKGPRFGAIIQHGYVVRDVEATARQWVEQMGVGPFYVNDQPIDDYVFRGKRVDLKLRIAVSYWRGVQLELIQPISPGDTFYSRALKRTPGKLNHYATRVTDVAAVVKSRNLEKYLVHTGATPGLKFAYMEDYLPDGTTLELMQIQDSTLSAFAAMEAICRTWDGTRPVRTMTEFMADIGVLRKAAAR
jgi:hypothetical protein